MPGVLALLLWSAVTAVICVGILRRLWFAGPIGVFVGACCGFSFKLGPTIGVYSAIGFLGTVLVFFVVALYCALRDSP